MNQLLAALPEAPQEWPRYLTALLLVMIRISGLLTFGPFFSSEAIPRPVKIVLLIALSVLLCPLVAAMPSARLHLDGFSILGELAVGLALGLALSMITEGVSFAAQLLGVQFSFSLVNLLDPYTSIETPLLNQLFMLFTSTILLTEGLHRLLLQVLLETFTWAPVGTVFLSPRIGPEMAAIASGIFSTGLQLALPVLTATILLEILIALMGRMMPQLQVMAVSIPAKTLTGYAILLASLGLWPGYLEQHFLHLLSLAKHIVAQTAGQHP